uniref:Small ribosomal subunit protein eS17 n=1 Tax=Thermofilum pendens TaxID=2269 RepID=A0A7C1SMF0_THEPE
MGNVRIRLVKRTARELLSRYPYLFTEDYEHNKQALVRVTDIPSKVLRNQIAGYITRLVKRQKRLEQLSTRQELMVTDEEEYIRRIEGV